MIHEQVFGVRDGKCFAGMAQSQVNAAIAHQALDKMRNAPYRSLYFLRQLLLGCSGNQFDSMTETEFMEVVREVRSIDDPSFLDIPLEAAPFDSLDLLELRASLETRLQLPLTDERFNSASTLRDLYLLVNQ